MRREEAEKLHQRDNRSLTTITASALLSQGAKVQVKGRAWTILESTTFNSVCIICVQIITFPFSTEKAVLHRCFDTPRNGNTDRAEPLAAARKGLSDFRIAVAVEALNTQSSHHDLWVRWSN